MTAHGALHPILPADSGPARSADGSRAMGSPTVTQAARGRPSDRSRRDVSGVLSVIGLVGCAAVLWGLSLPRIDPEHLDNLGLVSILPWEYWAALGLLTAGFAISLGLSRGLRWLPPAVLVALIVVLHATPPIVYETLRYSWAWKHVGIVDYIQRHGSVDPTITFLSAYHNWPGFFWASAEIANLFELGAVEIASLVRFFPVLTNLAYMFLLAAIYRRFTEDQRLVWASVLVFLCGNWVGQDYFSPQGFAFALYLLIIALCLGPLMPAAGGERTGMAGMVQGMRAKLARGAPRLPVVSPMRRIAATLVVTGAIAALVASHQLTPLVLVFSLLALAIVTPLSPSYPVLAALALAFWVSFPAASFTAAYLPGEIAEFGQAIGNATDNLVDTTTVGSSVAIVVWVGRALTAGIGLLAVLGWLRRLSVGARDGVAVALLAAPLPILVTTSYGGEALFRVYFFCLPFLAFFAAAFFFATPVAMRGPWKTAAFAVLAAMLAVGFLFGNNGKDRQYRFSHQEVEAATWLYARGGPGTLLVEGARSYPSQFLNYENFVYVPLSNERPAAREEILADPAQVLGRWFSAPRWADGYVILTRSQKAYVEALGVMPSGALDEVERSLLASPDFQLVFANRDARIFTATRFVGPEAR